MNRRVFLPMLIICVLVVTLLAASSAYAEPVAVQRTSADAQSQSQQETLVAGNYCISCHQEDDARLVTVGEWNGGIAREVNSRCPAATKVQEELYYTDRLLLMIERAQSTAGVLPDATQARLDGYTQRYSRLMDLPVTSLDAFVSEAQTTRYQLNKVYAVLNDMVEARKTRTVLIYAGLATLVLLGSLAWGLYNTRAIRAGLVNKSWGTVWRVLFLLAVLVFFALPIFRVPAAEVEMTTVEQQAALTVLDTAQRASDAADRAQARAWMFARIGSAWNEVDAGKGNQLLAETLSALKTAAQNNTALWGHSLAVQEATIGTPIEMESAGLIAQEINASRARAWALPLIASEVMRMDAAASEEILLREQEFVQKQTGLYRDLQLRSLALAWMDVSSDRSTPLARLITDPSLRAWTLRELAALTNDPLLFDEAAESARQIQDPVKRAAALRDIAAAANNRGLFAEALLALEETSGAARAYALSELAALSGDAELVMQIDPLYADARAFALLHLGHYPEAWDAASLITDPYEQAQAQAAIAAAWGNAEAAGQIAVPVYRDKSMRDVIQNTGNAALVDSIQSPYYKVQALVASGNLQSALEQAGALGDGYPLVSLAVALAESDPQAALDVVDQMSRESDKAVALIAIAAAVQDSASFEQAQGMALASRVRGDTLAPAQASFDLALAFWQIDLTKAQDALQQAYEAAQRIAIK